MLSKTPRRPASYAAVALCVPLLIAGALSPAAAQEGPFPSGLALTPEADAATSGTCNEFTAIVISGAETPLSGVMVDVTQALDTPGTEPGETRELSFCNPSNPVGGNPTGVGGTAFGDVGGNNPASTAGMQGRNTTVHGEVGPTDENGEVTFGISMQPASSGGTVPLSAWVDSFAEDDVQSEGEPGGTATKTWNPAEVVIAIDAAPESATSQNGSQHQVMVTVTSDGDPLEGLVPNSFVLPDGTGRPPGDAANELAGPSPNDSPGQPKPNVYSCTPSSAAGFSTCTYQDSVATNPGTDTVLFYVNQSGGTIDPDEGEPQDAVQVTWQNPAQPPPSGPPAVEARNIRLCHGEDVGAACVGTPATEAVTAEHLLSARVTDREGNPMTGIPVQLRESGPASFSDGDTHSVVATTGANGVARAVMTADEADVSVVVAEISPTSLPGSFRGPQASDDECEQPAGPGGTPAAGNCITSITVSWEAPECDDGEDNDGDGFVDADDPGCADGTEDPFDEQPSPPAVPHDRRVNMRFRDWVGPGDEGLAIFGRLRLSDEDDRFRKCTAGQPVEIQRLVDGEWVTKKFTTTNQRGRYAGVVFDLATQYRAIAARVEVVDNAGVFNVCRKAEKIKTHHHRR